MNILKKLFNFNEIKIKASCRVYLQDATEHLAAKS